MQLCLQLSAPHHGDYNFLQQEGATLPTNAFPYHLIWHTIQGYATLQPQPQALHPRSLYIPPNSTDTTIVNYYLPSPKAHARIHAALASYTTSPTPIQILYLQESTFPTYQNETTLTLNPNAQLTYTTTHPANSFLIRIESHPTNPRYLDQLLAYATLDLDNLIDDFIPTETTYSTQILTPYPLTRTAKLAHTITQKSARLRLTVPRDSPEAITLASILHYSRINATLELAETIDNTFFHLPVLITHIQTTPAGTLISYELELLATSEFPYSPTRIIQSTTTTSLTIQNPFPAPTPAELRLHISQAPTNPTYGLILHNEPSNQTIHLFIHTEGIWSLYDDGNLYHFNTTNGNKTTYPERIATHAPLILQPGENILHLISNPETPAYTINSITIAFHPRHSELTLL